MFLRIQIILVLIILLGCGRVYAQDWERHVVGKDLSVLFPYPPEFKMLDEGLGLYAYLVNQEDCVFMVGVAPGYISDYEYYTSLPPEKQRLTADTIIMGFLASKFQNMEPYNMKYRTSTCHGYPAIDVKFSMQPTEPISTRYTKVILVRDKLFVLDCGSITGKVYDKEQQKFFNSIELVER